MVALARRHVVVTALALTVLIGAFDYASGVTVTFVLLTYLVPIALATWDGGRAFGIAVAAAATGCATVIGLRGDPAIEAAVLNALGCFGMFGGAIWTLDRLRHYVTSEQRERRAAVEQLRHAERLNVIGVLAAGMAHELGTPLNVIAGTAEMIAADELPKARLDKAATVILAQTDKISAIIRHLLDFGRRGSPPRACVELDGVARAAAELLVSTARHRGVAIEVVPVDEVVRVTASGAEVEQVISNLVLNAIQAMPDGGRVRVSLGTATRLDAHGAPRAYGSVAVEDDGVGISAADLPRIFDPFFTTKDVGDGTGLGLSVSYGIVKDHGGAIEVHSARGQGACFTVLLPLAA